MVDLVDMRPFGGKNLAKNTFFWLKVESFAGRCRLGHAYWNCKCKCGAPVLVSGDSLRSNATLSCGCYKRLKGTLTNRRVFGETGKTVSSKEYRAWVNIIQRCTNPRNRAYGRYGGRGITICVRWRSSFDAFMEDMGAAPSPEMTVGRIDNNKGYSKDNCRWETMAEQSTNRETCRRLSLNGETMTMAEWSRRLGIPAKTIQNRVKRGLSDEDALNQNYKKYAG